MDANTKDITCLGKIMPICNKQHLTILKGKNCVLIISVQKFMEIGDWLLLTFLICLRNQLSSIHSIATYQKVQMFEQSNSSNRQNMNDCSFQ